MFVKKRLLLLLALLGFGLAVGSLWYWSNSRILTYQGKSVRTWVLEAYAGTNVSAAFAALGPSAAPGAGEVVAARELPWQRWGRWLAPKLPARLRQKLFGQAYVPTAVKLRCGAARCLGLLGPKAESAAPQLAQAMSDPEPAVRSDAISALAQLGKAAVPYLTLALREKDPHARLAAAFYLGRLGPEAAAVPDLALALQDKETSVRIEAATALRHIGPGAAAAVPALIRCLQNPDPGVRCYAGISLSEIRSPNVLALTQVINQGGTDAQKAAAKALVENYRALRLTAAVFRKLAQAPDAASRARALETLGDLRADDDASLKTLTAALKDPDPKVRLAAVETLSSISWRAQAALRALTACLDDPSPAVRAAAKEVLDHPQRMNR